MTTTSYGPRRHGGTEIMEKVFSVLRVSVAWFVVGST
jgi:hypothetical protein